MYQSSISVSTIVAGFGAAIFLFATVLIGADRARAQAAGAELASGGGPPSAMRPPLQTAIPEIKAMLEPDDLIAALQAIDVALTQAGDGATYVWRHGNGRLNGAVQMTGTFRDADGRICRHLRMLLNSGTYSRQREGIACRQSDGAWELDG